MNIIRNCEMCNLYYCQEVGDSDYGATYEDEPSCQNECDVDEYTGEHIKDFDRKIERDCCKLNFWKIIEIDKEIEDMYYYAYYDEENDEYVEDVDRAYARFKEKYCK